MTDGQWDEIIAGRIPQPSSDPSAMEKGNLLCSYISHQPVAIRGTLESELALELLLEEGGDSLQNFLLAAARRISPALKGKILNGETELPDPSHIREWTYISRHPTLSRKAKRGMETMLFR